VLRLPSFEYHEPRTLSEAIQLKSEAGHRGMYVAGGTDLFPNMKRRHQDPNVVISLMRVDELRELGNDESGLSIGSCRTLTQIVRDRVVHERYPSVSRTAALVSTPLLRNMGTIGGNLCLDTRCNYYNQGYEWRKAIDFCMKKDGQICWVAPSSPRCWAVQSSDLAPLMVAIGARYDLLGQDGKRTVPAEQFYHDDGIAYLSKQPDEILVRVRLPALGAWDATYWKLRRRGSFDFPVVGVAVFVQWDGERVGSARVILGAVASHPQAVPDAVKLLVGTSLDDATIEAAAQAAFRPSKPMDNTDFGLAWRKEMTRQYVKRALVELRQRQKERAA
jgi:4-hydroxybenzoyl-CoA reductase subunit beta